MVGLEVALVIDVGLRVLFPNGAGDGDGTAAPLVVAASDSVASEVVTVVSLPPMPSPKKGSISPLLSLSFVLVQSLPSPPPRSSGIPNFSLYLCKFSLFT